MFGRKKALNTPKEAEIQAIRQDMFDQVDKANKSIDKLTDLLDTKTIGVSEKIFLATGGDKRIKRTSK